MEFPYACHIDGNISKYTCDDPLVPIILHYGGKKFKTDGLVDSGCSMSHASADIARLLGVELSSPPCTTGGKSVGIGGEVSTFMIEIEFEVEGEGMIFRGPILFVENLPYNLLLGQSNFFDTFDINFQKSKGIFSIERSKY